MKEYFVCFDRGNQSSFITANQERAERSNVHILSKEKSKIAAKKALQLLIVDNRKR